MPSLQRPILVALLLAGVLHAPAGSAGWADAWRLGPLDEAARAELAELAGAGEDGGPRLRPDGPGRWALAPVPWPLPSALRDWAARHGLPAPPDGPVLKAAEAIVNPTELSRLPEVPSAGPAPAQTLLPLHQGHLRAPAAMAQARPADRVATPQPVRGPPRA